MIIELFLVGLCLVLCFQNRFWRVGVVSCLGENWYVSCSYFVWLFGIFFEVQEGFENL